MRDATDTAVIMAGGAGMRLRPYTCVLPKPLMPVGERPIIEILMQQLHAAGIANIVVSVGGNGHLMKAVVQDRAVEGLNLSYQAERAPLGTCGSLALMTDYLPERFLVINGDLLTDFPFERLIERHAESSAMLTVGTCLRDESVEFGVIERESNGKLARCVEKPVIRRELSIGAYALEKACVTRFLRLERAMDVPQLINLLLESGEEVDAVASKCRWIDIGNQEDYARAQQLFDENPGMFNV